MQAGGLEGARPAAGEPPAGSMEPLTPEAFSEIQSLYDRGLMLQALRAAGRFGPLSTWRGIAAATLAGRLAANLGAPRLAAVIHWRAWRTRKCDPDLAAYRAHTLLHRRGPLAAWAFLERLGEPAAEADPESLMHLLSVRAMTAAALRDFAVARDTFQRASALDADHPWLATIESHILEQEDRYEEALAAARRSLELRPWYRPGVQATTHALQLLDRDDEALALLQEAEHHLENLHLTRQLAVLQTELGRHAEAAASLDRAETLAPLSEPEEQEWFRRHRVTLACLRGDLASALERAKQVDDPYYQGLAQRIESGAPKGRVRLDVPFVRQHHMTCAPATLSALSRFWSQPAEHLEVAEAICYDGTPAHSERHWAETHGWVVREFTVTPPASRALLDRGVPFTLTTSEATSSHLQAVVGYDELRETLWIRDPFVYYTGEVCLEPLLNRYRATGPRGMALVPAHQQDRLAGLELPDADLYDQLHALHCALAQHRRADALRVCEALQAAVPGHRLALTARRAVAAYDDNTPALLQCLDELLLQFPDNGNLNLARLSCLRELARREDRVAMLARLAGQPGTDPIFWQQYGHELRADARQLETAASWMRWALRYRPTDPDLISAWADVLWDQRRFTEATRYYRLAACLGDRREQFARSYFAASRHLRQTELALEFLRARARRLGPRSGEPAITCIEALQQLGRTAEAFETLQAALALRPADGCLRLFAADFHARFGRFDQAGHWLREARPHCSAAAWNRTAASIAGYQGDKPLALSRWREVLATEPLAHDAIRAVATLRAETEGHEAALRYLDELCERFPCSCPLLRLRLEWLKDGGDSRILPRLQQLLEVNPADAWAWRELALQCERAGQKDEALRAAQEAIRLEPQRANGYCTRGDILLRRGQIEAGRADLREAIRLEVDNGFAIVHFVTTAPTLAERQQALTAVADELRRQVILSGALFAYRDAARGLLTPADVLSLLREAHAVRPDLWQTWSVLAQQLVDVGKHPEALDCARQATERFPLLAELWVDLARVQHARLDTPGEIAALEKALELSPGYAYAARLLAGIHERHHDLARARAVLERAIVASPLDAFNHGCLASVVWKLGDRETALARLQHALRLEPGYDWAWATIRQWESELGRPGLAADLARDLTRRRAGEPRSWLLLARCLSPAEAADELFAALDRTLVLNPLSEEAFDHRAVALAQLNRFEEALRQCSPPAFPSVPVRLRIRAAWVEAQRGNLARAIARAEAALAENPEYDAGWQLLSDWHLQNQDLDGAVRAAEKMAALAPLEAVPLGYLADLKLRLRDTAGAKAALQRAFTLDPEYYYAGFGLFRLQLAARELNDAEQTLAVLRRGGENPATRGCAVKLAAARGDHPGATECFKQLCEEDQADESCLGEAAAALEQRISRKAIERLIEERLRQPHPPPALAEWWVSRQTSRKRWALHARLSALKTDGEAGRRAVLRYLDCLGEAFQEARQKGDVTGPLRFRYHLHRLMNRHRAWLRDDVEGWGKVGFVLAAIGHPKPAIHWLGDWRQHPKAESWMLYNLVLMLHRERRHEEAFEIIRHAVSLRHGGRLFEAFTLWAAFEEALRGHVAAAEQHLASLPPESVDEHRRPIQIMTQLLIAFGHPNNEDRETLFRTLRTTLRSAFGKQPPCGAEPYARTGYLRFMRVAADRIGGWRLWLWGRWFYRRHKWLLLPLLVVLVPAVLVIPPGWVIVWILWRNFRPK